MKGLGLPKMAFTVFLFCGGAIVSHAQTLTTLFSFLGFDGDEPFLIYVAHHGPSNGVI